MRKYCVLWLAAWVVSSLFPLLAGTGLLQQPSEWIGFIDVSLALALVLSATWIKSRRDAEITVSIEAAAFTVVRVGSNGLLLLLALFLIGIDLRWDILLVGLSWRVWLLLFVMPQLLACYKHLRA